MLNPTPINAYYLPDEITRIVKGTKKVKNSRCYPQTPIWMGYATVYHLSDNKGEIFYVGCTVLPIEKRLAAHIYESRRMDKIKTNVAKSNIILSLNGEVKISAFEKIYVPGRNKSQALSNAIPREKFWITYCIDNGIELCNRMVPKRNKAA